MAEVRITVEQRTEFGKGAARRTRRAGKIPAVLYGHGAEPRHLALPAVEFARAVRENGQNAVLTLEVAGAGRELALTKMIVAHPIKSYIEHVDLLLVQRGEQVVVDVPVIVTGNAAPGTLVNQDVNELSVEAEALHIPEQLELSIEGAEAGTQLHASDVPLPRGVTLQTDPEILIVHVSESPTEAELEGAPAEEAVAEEVDEG